LSGRGLCDELITRPEESYQLWCVVVCDLETSRICAPYIYDISCLRVNPQYHCSSSGACNDSWECYLPYPGRRHSEEISLLNMFKNPYIATF